MEKTRIASTGHPLYTAFKEIYAGSFPVFEQRTEAQQQAAFSSAAYRLTAYTENGTFIGFMAYWTFGNYVYIEHFAMSPALRGNGYGSRALYDFVSGSPRTVLLEIDPVTDAVSAARLRFYERCGFHANGYRHIHPPYREGYSGHPLVVLSSGRPITPDEYALFARYLAETVMKQEDGSF